MPALSPTMNSGTISKWNCKVGGKATAGDALAEVETDKATVTFESQDDFVIAKLLVEEGAEVKVGDPIMITVDDASSVSAFANYVLSAPLPSAAAAVPAPAPVAAPVAAPAPVAPKVEAPAPKKEAPKPAAAAAPAPKAPAPVAAPAAAPAASFAWGTGVERSPLFKLLVAEQEAYCKKYGHASSTPLKAEKTEKASK